MHASNFRDFLNNISDGIIVININEEIIINQRVKDILNIDDSESIIKILSEQGLLNLKTDDSKIIRYKNKMLSVKQINNNILGDSTSKTIIIKEISSEDIEITELKQSLQLMKDVLDNAYQGVVLVNEEGKIIKWNYEKLFGVKEEDVLGKPVEEVIENTRMHIVVKTGKKELYDVQKIHGHNMIASRTPIIKKGKVIGAVGTVLFKDTEELKNLAIKLKVLEGTVDKYKNEISTMYCANYSFDDIIAQNSKMIKLKEIARKASNSSSTVLITGESGTGKEYFAHAIHAASQRKNGPFIRINCAAIPSELLESELFGYEAGAFTGAKKEGKIGKMELANGGTLLLDEISSLPFNMQAKLLRVLEERELERIGGNTGIKIDIKVIACTNEDLFSLISEGKFRQDLYFRLNVVEINVPPLRDRLDDIPILCDNILNKQIQSVGLTSKMLTDRSILALKLYDWPGNVRELRNVLERAANMSSNDYIDLNNLPDYISDKLIAQEQSDKNLLLKEKVAETEINTIIEALKTTNGSRTEAARILGIHRTALYKKLDNYGIDIKAV